MFNQFALFIITASITLGCTTRNSTLNQVKSRQCLPVRIDIGCGYKHHYTYYDPCEGNKDVKFDTCDNNFFEFEFNDSFGNGSYHIKSLDGKTQLSGNLVNLYDTVNVKAFRGNLETGEDEIFFIPYYVVEMR